MIAYQDFDLRLRSDGDRYAVIASLDSQDVSEPLTVDLSRSWELDDLERESTEAVRRRGAELFDALIPGRVRALYHQARGRIGNDAGAGIRIRLRFDPRDPQLRPLLRLPWEIAFDGSADGGGKWPALDPRYPIVRTIDSMEPAGDPGSGPLQRVVLAQSNPGSSEPLAAEREITEVQTALGCVGVSPIVLRHATRSTLIEAISDREPQVLHFAGHGVLDETTGQGMLLLESDFGIEDQLDAATLAALFAGKRPPRLVLLTACLSATTGAGADPFSAMAIALVAAGLPAVIAMQSEVLDHHAIRFSSRLYRRLVQGDPVEAAVAEARKAASAGLIGTLDWAAPVLFVRGHGAGTVLGEQGHSAPARQEPSIQQTVKTEHVDTQFNIAHLGTMHYHKGSDEK